MSISTASASSSLARTGPYLRDGELDSDGLLAEAQTMSGGERVLARIAYDLWEAKGIVGVWELARRLDRRNFERVIDALAICRGDLHGRSRRPHNARAHPQEPAGLPARLSGEVPGRYGHARLGVPWAS
jgi:hypothetical protein